MVDLYSRLLLKHDTKQSSASVAVDSTGPNSSHKSLIFEIDARKNERVEVTCIAYRSRPSTAVLFIPERIASTHKMGKCQ